MSDNEEEYVDSESDQPPVKGELKMVRVRKQGVDIIELRFWNGSDWESFDKYLHPGGDDE